MIHSLCYWFCCRKPRVWCSLAAAFPLILQSCTFARTSAKISEIGARYNYADCGVLEKNVLFEKDGCYYVKARQRVCERQEDLWGTMAVALNYWGYRDEPLPEDEQPSGYVAVLIPRDLAFRMSGSKLSGMKNGRAIRFLEEEPMTAMPEIDLAGARETAIRYPLTVQDSVRSASCGASVPDLYVWNGCETGGLHAWIQPVAWLDAFVVDAPLSVVATPVRWASAGYKAIFRTP